MKFIYKPIYWSYRASSWLWYWARRRFTFAGWAAGVALTVTAAVGLDIENTVTYQAFALLLGLGVFALGSSFFFRAKFSATRMLPRLGTAGQPLHYQVLIRNRTKKVQSSLVMFDDFVDPRPGFAEWLAYQRAEERRSRPFRFSNRRHRSPFRLAEARMAEIPPIPAQGEVEVRAELFPLRRGILQFKGVTVALPDPFGLFRAFQKISAPDTVLILPRRYALPAIALPGSMRYQEGGVALAANVGSSEEFVALRDYRHGDPLRHIHWRSWAKVGKPIVKEFEDEFFVRHALVLDTFDEEPNSEVLEEAVSVASSFACTILTQESLLDLLFVGNKSYCFTAGRGLAQADQMLEILAAVQNCADRPFATLEHLVLNHISLVSGCIVVLQKWDGPRQEFIGKLKALGVPMLVLVIVPAGVKILDEHDTLQVLEVGKIQEGLSNLK